MDPDDSQSFDLAAFVAESLPAMLDAESDPDTWPDSTGRVPKPASALWLDESSPLHAYLGAEPTHPEGATRAEQAEFYAARDAAREAATQAAQDAATQHARNAALLEARRQADALQARFARGEQARQERESKGTTGLPVRDASKAPEGIGRW